MKKIVLFAVLATMVFNVQDSYARTTRKAASPCKKTVSVQSGGYIYKNSAPLRSGGVGTPLIGYRNEPTLIMLRNVSSKGTTNIYSTNFQKIGSCPWASAHDAAGGRYRCTMQTASLRRAAVSSSRSASILFKINGSTCVLVPDAGRCYGSVKGRCNQLIK